MSQHATLPNSYLRFFQAMPTTQSYDLYLDEKRWAKDVLYEDFTKYRPLEDGEHQIAICPYRLLEPLYQNRIWISKQRIYTLVLAYMPNTDTCQSYLINEPHKPIPEEHLLMRTANFSAYTAPLSLHLLDTKPIFKRIPLRQSSSYLGFLPSVATVELMDLESQTCLLQKQKVCFKVTRYYTLYIIGGTKQYPLKWIQTIDGNSFLHFEH